MVPFIQSLGHEIEDFGCNCDQSVDYPDYALPVCDNVVAGQADRGILICGTGIGMSIAANKVPGIRCALVHDMFSAKATREHNDTNVLAMGERVIGPGISTGNHSHLAGDAILERRAPCRTGQQSDAAGRPNIAHIRRRGV